MDGALRNAAQAGSAEGIAAAVARGASECAR